MSKDCGCNGAQGAQPSTHSAGVAATPTLFPPFTLNIDSGGSTMSDQMPTQNPPAEAQTEGGVAAAGDAAPILNPESEVAAVSAGGVGTWVNNKRVSALWGINQNRNSWVHIAGVGWRKLANNSDSAVVALTILGAHAKQTQTTYNFREETDGMIHETYVW